MNELQMIDEILDAENMLHCAEKLEAFVKHLSGLPSSEQTEEALAYFWATLFDESVVSREFDDPENHGWQICPQEKSIATYLGIELFPRKTVSEDLSYLSGYAQALKKEFGPASESGAKEEQIRSVLEFMDTRYDLSRRLFSRQRAAFILLSDLYLEGTAATLFHYYSDADFTAPHFAFFGGSAAGPVVRTCAACTAA